MNVIDIRIDGSKILIINRKQIIDVEEYKLESYSDIYTVMIFLVVDLFSKVIIKLIYNSYSL